MSETEVHLLVLIHGMWGNPSHLAELERIVKETHQATAPGLEVLVAQTNSEDSTYDGIDWGGERLAEEIVDHVASLQDQGKKVTKFSVTGYSLGGLLGRYVIGILHQRKFFENVQPMNFNTIATPHMGLPRYPTFFSGLAHFLGPKLLSRTGEQFYAVDKWSYHGRPLLEVMADPDRLFYQALARFPHKRIYANAVSDMTVPYVTAALEAEDPFLAHDTNGIEIVFDDKYRPIVKSFTLPAIPPPQPPKPRPLTGEWLRSFKPSRPLLPPFLQFKFPYNIILYTTLPILIPTFFTMAIVRLSLASRRSSARLRLLETGSVTLSGGKGEEGKETDVQRLMHILREMEKQMEDAVAEIVDEPARIELSAESTPAISRATSPPATSPSSESANMLGVKVTANDNGKAGRPAMKRKETAREKAARTQAPILTPVQLQIIEWMNSLPGLEKERVFIHPVRNSHATIVCRDVQRFPSHKMGEGVLRHWADHLVL